MKQNLTQNEMKMMPVITYQKALEYSNKEMAERCSLTTDRYNDLLSNPNSMTVEELYNISIGIEMNIEGLLGTIMLNPIKYFGISGYGENNLRRIIEKDKVTELVNYINNGTLKYKDGYKLTDVHGVEEEISQELAKEICELLLTNGHISSFLKFAGSDNILGIKDLSDLDKYSENVKEAILFGIDTKLDAPCINLPKYYFDLLNDLSEADQELVLTKTLTRAERIINFTDYDFTKVEKKSGILELVMLRQNELRGNNNDF